MSGDAELNRARARAQELAYWRTNLRIVGGLLIVWFLVSFGAGILFAEALDAYSLAGFPLGFWFAQQGAIYTFVALIFIYVILMNRVDHRFGVADDEGATPPGGH
jgi:putative solute:sodium symporter small subunit